ncbi:MAG TPA: YceI family protein [Micromonosporaceae bacterium]
MAPAVVRIGPHCGSVVVRTGRTGVAGRAGHDLTIDVTDWTGEVRGAGDDPSGASLRVDVALASLRVREGTGGALPLSDRDRAEIDATMRRMLAPIGTETATFVSTSVTPSGDGGTVDGMLTLRDRKAPVRLTVERLDGDRYRGAATVVQTAHGVKPYSGFLGALKVRDEVVVEFDVDLGRAEPAT